MYALQTVGSTTSSVKDDTEVLDLDDVGNSIVEQIITNSNAVKRSGNPTANGYQSSQTHPAIHNYERNVKKDHTVSLPYIMLHTFAYLVSALGLCAMYVHKETGKPEGSAFYEGHLYSIHSWAGVFAAAMFTIQWLTAAATFIMPCLLKIGLPLGKMFSLYTTIVSTIAVISGVNQHAMKTLAKDYRMYSTESLVLNGFGILFLLDV
ncbi:cytochrome b ascorbate-dependent protein 3-like, partial [Aphis craccivora]